ncbi:MAG: DUF2079 domain-containing protein [Anaerolineae bacterium]|nr:DUF2079 domain-containing protein [Anaerolineae bacterium]
MKHLRGRTAVLFLSGAVVVYAILFGVLSLLRYDTFHASTFDLGIMAQATWNTAHGRWFETSIDRATNTELIGSYLGNHVRPVLLFLAPIYRVWPDPRLLLVLQSVALGLAAFPLYLVVRKQTEDTRAALIVACCYLAYPALGFLNLVDFHPVAFSIPLIFLAYWALQEERMGLFWIAVSLSLFVKEEMLVPIAAWGLVNLLWGKRRRIGLGLVILAGGWAILCFGLIIPTFNEGQPYRFWQLWVRLRGALPTSDRGGTAQSIGSASFETIALYLIHLLLPLGFLPFLGYTSLVVALPSLAYLLLGERPAFHSVGYQYPAVLIPWFFLAVAEGLRRLRHRGRLVGSFRPYRLGLAFMVFGTLGINIALNPIYLYARAGMFRPEPYHDRIAEALAQIPSDAGVATVNRFGPQLANRRVLVALEYPAPLRLDHVGMADYILIDLVDCRVVPAPDPRTRYADIVVQVLQMGSFRVRYWSGRILLLERGAPVEEETAAILDYVSDLVEQDYPCWP